MLFRSLLSNLRYGASSCQKSSLQSCFVQNAKPTLKYGREVTDVVAYWVKNSYVSGPFKEPPLAKFSVNPIIAVEQEDKVRAVLNVTNPLGKSLNSNIDMSRLEKFRMSSARNFGYTVRKFGKCAKMSKFDLEAANKQVPVPIDELRLQGFSCMNRFFVELDQILVQFLLWLVLTSLAIQKLTWQWFSVR